MLDSRRASFALVVLGLALLFALQLAARAPLYTGDEPRYVHSAVSLFERGDLNISFDEWQNWAETNRFPTYSQKDFELKHSPVHAFLASPIIGRISPDAGRWLAFVTAAITFTFTLVLALKVASPLPSFGAALLTFATIPLLSYSRLLYAEIWLACLFSGAWYFLYARGDSQAKRALFLIFALALPFFHLRMSLVSAGLILLALRADLSAVSAGGWAVAVRKAAPMLGISAFAALGLVAFQLGLTGSIAGTAGAPFHPSIGMFIERLTVQLLSHRHGLLVFNPLMLLAIVGLLASAVRGEVVARDGIILATLYVLTFVWGAASESAPARFWVAIMPVLAVGLAYWLQTTRSSWLMVFTVVFGILSVANSALYLLDPNIFLENREFSLSYDRLFQLVPAFYFPHLLPWDSYFFLEKGMNSHFDFSKVLFIRLGVPVALVGTLLTVASVFKRGSGKRFLSGSIAAAMVAFFLWSAWLCEVPKLQIVVDPATAAPGGRSSSVISFAKPIQPVVLRFHDSPSYWRQSLYPDMFEVEGQVGQAPFVKLGFVPAGPLVRLPVMDPVDRIRLTATSGAETNPAWQARISVLARACNDSGLSNWQPLAINDLVEFGAGLGGARYLGAGWHDAEPWGVWSRERNAWLEFVIDRPLSGSVRLGIDGQVLIGSFKKTANVEVLANGRYAGTMEFDQKRNRDWRFLDISSSLGDTVGPQVLRVKLAIDSSVQPSKVGFNQDGRALGFGLISIRFDSSD